MNKIKKILVTTDNASEMSTALHVGADLAARIGAELHVLHVVKSFDADYSFAVRDLSESITRKVDDELKATLKDLPNLDKFEMHTSVRIGAPANQVLAYTKDHEIDLVVIEVKDGGQGTKRLGVLSSVLARAVPFDVLFVHPGMNGPFEKLVVATDYSDCAADAMRRAVKYIKLHGRGAVTAVHSFELPARHYYTGHTPEEIRETFKGHAEKHWNEWMAKIDTDGVTVSQEVIEGSPASSVMDYAKSSGADLLVIGSHGRTASSMMMLGSVAQKIVLNADCNVWVERTEGSAMGFWGAIKRAMGLG